MYKRTREKPAKRKPVSRKTERPKKEPFNNNSNISKELTRRAFKETGIHATNILEATILLGFTTRHALDTLKKVYLAEGNDEFTAKDLATNEIELNWNNTLDSVNKKLFYFKKTKN
jgi:hypothetical protein